jgi:hypothetical protein
VVQSEDDSAIQDLSSARVFRKKQSSAFKVAKTAGKGRERLIVWRQLWKPFFLAQWNGIHFWGKEKGIGGEPVSTHVRPPDTFSIPN